MKTDTFVVLLHGLGATPHTLLGVEKYLNWQGFHRTHKLSYPVDTLPLEECIDKVSEELEQIVSKDEQIIVIGQSMGGVVGNQLHTRGWQIELLITIGSPLKGASLVQTLKEKLPQRVQDLLHKPMYEDLIKLLEEPLKEPPHKYHCFTMAWPLTNFDGCVYVEEGKFEDEHHTHLPMADHRTIFANPRLWWHVHKCIEDKVDDSEQSTEVRRIATRKEIGLIGSEADAQSNVAEQHSTCLLMERVKHTLHQRSLPNNPILVEVAVRPIKKTVEQTVFLDTNE